MKPTGNAQAAPYDFLQPARAADEMGRLGPYRILRVLGAGAMGVVFLAEDTRCRRQVALKALKPNLPNIFKARQRFLLEGKATADLHHENVVTIYDVDQSGDVPYLAMEYLQGETLDARMRREPRLRIDEVLRIGRETAEGLAAAHRHGLIHRDIKPSNLWLEGQKRRVKILDFGLARHTGVDQTNLTQAGFIIGTPSYMPPEQAKGETIDARADLFSLGCVLYRIGTGELPFKGKDTLATLLALTIDSPMPPVKCRPDLPPELNHLILCLLAKQPDQRPPSGDLVAQAIRIVEQRLSTGAARPPLARQAVPVLNGAAGPPGSESTELAVSLTAGSAPKRPPVKMMRAAFAIAGAALLVLALFLLLAALGRPGDGVLSFETEEPDAAIVLVDQGREVAVLGSKSRREVQLKPGEYEVDVRRGGDGLRLSAERVTVERGGRHVVRLSREVLGSPISPGALVTMPPRLPDVTSWTLETRGHRGPIRVAALSTDGKWLATGSDDGTVRVWSYPAGELARVLLGHSGAVTGLSWSADGPALSSFGADKKAFVWECDDPKFAKSTTVKEATVPAQPAIIAVPDNKKLSVAGGRVLMLDAKTNKEIKVLVQPRPVASPIAALAAGPDGKTIASIHADQSIRLWEANSGRELHILKAADAPKPLLASSPDGKTLATSHGTTLRLWDVDAGTESKNVATVALSALAWSPNSKVLAMAGQQLQLWEAESSQMRTVKTGVSGSVAWSPDSKAVVVGGSKGVEVWDLDPDKMRVKCDRPAAKGVSGVAWSPDGKVVADATDTGTRLYDPKNGSILQKFGVGAGAAPLAPNWSPDGRFFVSGGDGKAEVHEAPTYKLPRPFPVPLAGHYIWSPDGHTLACAQGGDVRLFDADTRLPRGMMLSPGTDQGVFVLATGHYRGAAGGESDLVYVAQTERGQQTLTPTEFAKAYGWKNDPRWVRFTQR